MLISDQAKETFNFLADRLHDRVRTKRLSPSKIECLSNWILTHHVMLEGKPMNFEDRPWMQALYDDLTPHIVLIKATQVGGSVWAILHCIQKCKLVADWRGWVYFFPTKTDVQDFSRTRVKPL